MAMRPDGLLSIFGVLIVDQLTKAWASAALREGDVALLPVLNLRLGFNTGVSFGMLSDAGFATPGFLVLVKSVIVVFLLVWLVSAENRIERRGLGFLIGGAVGNTIDRLHHGAVVDFLDLHIAGWHWPTFNLADVAITCGVLGLLWSNVFSGRPKSKHDSKRALRA